MYDLLQTMRWSKVFLDEYAKEKVNIENVLPKIGESIKITLELNSLFEDQEEGFVHFLWLPPFSDTNGLDVCPSDFLKSRIISGYLTNLTKNPDKYLLTFDFKVESIIRSLDAIEKLDGASYFKSDEMWDYKNNRILKMNFNNYMYLNYSPYSEERMETILSKVGDDLFLIYYSYYNPVRHTTNILKYRLNKSEKEFFKTIDLKVKNTDFTQNPHLLENEVEGFFI